VHMKYHNRMRRCSVCPYHIMRNAVNVDRKKTIRRVLMVNPQGYVEYPAPLGKTDTGGQTVYVLQLAKALAKKNIKVDILTRQFDNKPEEEQIFDNVKIVRMPAGSKHFVPKEKMYELMPELVENFMKYTEAKKKEYDIIHSHYWDGGYGGILLSKMMDVPHVNTPHGLGKLKKLEMSPEQAPVQKLKPFYRYHVRIAIEQKIMNTAKAIIVLSETNRIQILQHYMTDFEKLHVIYPGVDTENFNPKKTSVDKTLDMKPNAILAVSRIAPTKGIDRLIDAVALLKGKISFHLYIGGSLNSENASEEEKSAVVHIKHLIAKYKLERQVSFIGIVPHDNVLPAYYRNAAVFVLPSRYEPFGLTPLEAMACGTVPIVSSIAGVREVIIDGLNGLVVDTHDRKTLASSILKFLEDEKLRKKVADNAAFTVQEHYSWDKITEKFIELYKSLL